jgi:hypothetical protein
MITPYNKEDEFTIYLLRLKCDVDNGKVNTGKEGFRCV